MLIEKKPIDNGELKNDWIHGHNSIIKVLLLLSEITEDEKYRKFSLEIFEKLSEEPILISEDSDTVYIAMSIFYQNSIG